MRKICTLSILSILMLVACGTTTINYRITEINSYTADGELYNYQKYSYNNEKISSIETSDRLYLYYYNEDGTSKSDICKYKKNDGTFVDSDYKTYSYDTYKRLIGTNYYEYDKDSNSYVISDITSFEYDNKGRQTVFKSYTFDENFNIIFGSCSLTKYNSNNLVISEEDYVFNDVTNTFEFFSEETYEYDNLNILVRHVSNDSQHEPLIIDNYLYNENGMLDKIKTTKIIDEEETPFKEVSFEYNSNNLMIMQKEIYLIDFNGLDDSVIRKEYDNNNRLTKTSYFDLEDEEETLTSYIEYNY